MQRNLADFRTTKSFLEKLCALTFLQRFNDGKKRQMDTTLATELNGRYNKVVANGRSILRERGGKKKNDTNNILEIRRRWASVHLSRGNNTIKLIYSAEEVAFFLFSLFIEKQVRNC